LSKNLPGGDAATVAGYAGPGFHIWPLGHYPQATDPNALIRIRPPAFAKKSFGETFGAATGVSDPSYRRNLGARATTLGPRIRTIDAAATPPL
jgi:hypothetical protein